MTANWLDQSAAVRHDETFEVEHLERYLKAQLPDLEGTLQLSQFPKGFSNLTYLLRFDQRELVLRRPPFGANIKGGHDMGREYKILSHLYRVYPKVPRALHYCTAESVMGASFYVMERVKGIILRNSMPPEAHPSATLMEQIAEAVIDNLADLHAVDYEAAGLADLGKPAGYVQRQIGGWSKRYQQAKSDDVPDMDRVITWLTDHQPPEEGAALIHNDYKYNNLMLDPTDWTQVTAVLDWEMSTLGDPLMDLGTALAYWIEPGAPPLMKHLKFSPTHWPGNPSRAAVVERYVQKSGRDGSHIVFYYAYGLFKLAVIAQQIYARYKLGYTQDERFAHMNQNVALCSQIALQAINKGQIDNLF